MECHEARLAAAQLGRSAWPPSIAGAVIKAAIIANVQRLNTLCLMLPDDFHYELLRQITDQPNASQRGLAARLGVSVGKINYCLQALIEKGWVKADNFRRSDSKWAYAYLLTPRGARAKMRLARDFLSNKEREFERLQHEIATLRGELRQMGHDA